MSYGDNHYTLEIAIRVVLEEYIRGAKQECNKCKKKNAKPINPVI